MIFKKKTPEEKRVEAAVRTALAFGLTGLVLGYIFPNGIARAVTTKNKDGALEGKVSA